VNASIISILCGTIVALAAISAAAVAVVIGSIDGASFSAIIGAAIGGVGGAGLGAALATNGRRNGPPLVRPSKEV
jgi:hypothetical protein